MQEKIFYFLEIKLIKYKSCKNNGYFYGNVYIEGDLEFRLPQSNELNSTKIVFFLPSQKPSRIFERAKDFENKNLSRVDGFG